MSKESDIIINDSLPELVEYIQVFLQLKLAEANPDRKGIPFSIQVYPIDTGGRVAYATNLSLKNEIEAITEYLEQLKSAYDKQVQSGEFIA